MKNAGYIYVNIDDCWQGTRDEQGRIQPNEKFGDMKALVNYVHAKGPKIGIYSSLVPKRLFATAPPGIQRVVIRADSEIGVVRPEFHGHFIEHLGSCVYGGLWISGLSRDYCWSRFGWSTAFSPGPF